MSEQTTDFKYKPIGGGSFWPKDEDEGKALYGVLLSKDLQTSRFNGDQQVVLTIECADGSIKKVGVSSGLKSSEPSMKQGRAYRITYEGKRKGKGPLPFKAFRVDEIENYDPAQVVPF